MESSLLSLEINCWGVVMRTMLRWRQLVLVLLLGSFLGLPVMAQKGEALPPEMLAKLKNATVFLKAGQSRGSSFLIHRTDKRGFLISNHHVIVNNSGRISRRVEAIFYSGSPEERRFTAKVVASDREADLAVLAIEGADLPDPISIFEVPEIRETLPVFMIGFPFAEAIGLGEGNPALSIATGTIASLRRDKKGHLETIQLDGDLNPGNSGGPIVTTDGKLVGVAVATLMGTQISWAIPTDAVRKLCQGGIERVSLTAGEPENGRIKLQVSADLVDPFENLVEVFVTAALGEEVSKLPNVDTATGKCAAMETEAKPIKLVRKGDTASVEVSLGADESGPIDYIAQIGYRTKNDVTIYLEPISRRFTPGEKETSETSSIALDDTSALEKLGVVRGACTVTIDDEATDFAFNHETGDIAIVDSVEGFVRLYRASFLDGDKEEGETPVRVGDLPVSICYKRYKGASFYAVACYGEARLHVFDAKTMNVIKRIPIKQASVSLVTTSLNPQDPNLYYAYGRGHGSKAGRVSLLTMSDEGDAFGDAMDFAISADGFTAYRRGPWSPSGFVCMENVGDLASPSFVQAHRDHRSTPRYFPGPFSRVVATGNAIYTANLKRKIATLGFSPTAFFEDRPVIAGISSKYVYTSSYNTFALTGVAQLPADFLALMAKKRAVPVPNTHADFKRLLYALCTFADSRHGRLIICHRDQILLVPLAALGVEDEPLMLADMQGSEHLTVGKTHQFAIRPRDARVKMEFIGKPEGSTVKDSVLTWTPGVDDVGTHSLEVKLTWKENEYEQAVGLIVSMPRIKLPFAPSGVSVAPDAKRAVCWGAGKAGTSGISQLGLIDLESNTVITNRYLPYLLQQAAVDAQFVYTVPRESTHVAVLDRSTLAERKRIFLGGNCTKISSPGDRCLVLSHAGNENVVYSLPGLKRRSLLVSDEPAAGGAHPAASKAFRSLVALGDAWYVDGIVYDYDFAKVQLIQSPEGVLEISDANGAGVPRIHQVAGDARIPSRWGRRISKGALLTATGQSVAKIQGSMLLELDSLPAVAALRVSGTGDRRTTHLAGTVKAELMMHDLATGQLQRSYKLGEQHRPARKSVPYTMGTAAGRIVVTLGDFLFAVDMENSLGDVAPLRFAPKQSRLCLPEKGDAVLVHTLEGGTPPYEYFLGNAKACIDIDPKSGQISVANEAVIKFCIDALVSHYGKAGDTADKGEPTKRRVLAALQKSRAEAIRITGKSMDGFPLALPVNLRAMDSAGQTAELNYHVLALVQEEQVLAALPQALDSAVITDSRNAEATASSEAETVVREGAHDSVDNSRLREIESRMDLLEAKVDLLTELLHRRKKE